MVMVEGRDASMRRDVELAEDVEDLVEDVERASGHADAVMVSLADDETIDFFTDRPVKARGNERVRQQVARSLSAEYGIPVDDMARDFPIPVEIGGTRRVVKTADIAVFAPGGRAPRGTCSGWLSASRSPRAAR